jgi:hypothetical protein
MAEVSINVKIEAAESAKTIQELRKTLKALVSEQANVTAGSAEWRKLNKAINDTEGRIGDLTDSFKTLQGSGVERVNSSFNLLREGFANFDFGKIGASLKGLGSAFRAIPIFLIVEGITALIANFDKLKTSGGLIGKIFSGIGTAIDAVGDAINYVTDAIGLTDSALDKQGENLKVNADKSKEALEGINAEYDRQIALISASGKSTIEIERQKQEAIKRTSLELIKQNLAYQQAGGKLTEEQSKQLLQQVNDYKNAKNQLAILDIKETKEKQDKQKVEQDDYKKHLEELNKIRQDAQNQINELEEQERSNLLAFNQTLEAEEKKKLEDQLAADDAAIAAQKARLDEIANYEKEQDRIREEAAKKKEADDKLRLDRQFQTQQNYFGAVSALSDVFFSMQLAGAEGNEDALNEIRKKQFNVDKALKATQATIDGYKAVTATLAQGGAFAVPLAISTGVLAFANVVKILATKFNPSSTSVRPSAGATPRLNTNTSSVTPQQTNLPGQGGTFIKPDTKVYVSEKEINDTRNRKARVEEQAIF